VDREVLVAGAQRGAGATPVAVTGARAVIAAQALVDRVECFVAPLHDVELVVADRGLSDVLGARRLPLRELVTFFFFMNPVPMKSAVELISGRLTSERTVERTRDFLGSLGKSAIPVNDACGFVSNRVLMLTVNEAAFLVHEGVADAATVDEVFRDCFGHPMGPLETADLIGIDTVLYSIEGLHEHFGDPKFRPCPLLREMAAAGWHGRKTGRGFHHYDGLGQVIP
jgi:3-hydroxyacyl-CoA dehydrogenase